MPHARPDPFRAPVLVFSGGPAGLLGQLGYLQRLRYVVQIALPPAVVAGLPGWLAENLRATRDIYVTTPNAESLAKASQAAHLDPRDTEALALGVEDLGPLVADAPDLQVAASQLEVPLVTTLGVLVELRGVGLAPGPLRRRILDLEDAGMKLPQRLRDALDGNERTLWVELQAAATDVAWGPETGLESAG